MHESPDSPTWCWKGAGPGSIYPHDWLVRKDTSPPVRPNFRHPGSLPTDQSTDEQTPHVDRRWIAEDVARGEKLEENEQT